MKCPRCDLYAYVYKTYRDDGIIFRKRRCALKHEFYTHETLLLEKGQVPALTTDDIVSLLRRERGIDEGVSANRL